jgi:hypothetical protein
VEETEINQQILQAIDTLVTAKTDNLKYDKTIIGTILEKSNPSANEYRVSYHQGTLYAYSSDDYDIGTNVYVLIPESNFSNRKIIVGIASNITELPNYSIVSPEILSTFYNFDTTQTISFTSLGQTYESNDFRINFKTEDSLTEIYKYGQKYHYLLLKIDVKDKTILPYEVNNSTWSIDIYSRFLNNDNSIYDDAINIPAWSFGIHPYTLENFTTLTFVINLRNTCFLGVEMLELSNWGYYTEDKEKYSFAQPDMFFKNIELYFIDDYSEPINPLSIVSSQGIDIASFSQTTLSPQLKIGLNNVLNNTNCNVEWFISNLEIDEYNDDYDGRVGVGWEKINNDFSLSVEGKDLLCAKQYKVMVLYKNKYYYQTIILYGDNKTYNPFFLFKQEGNTLKPNTNIKYDNNLRIRYWSNYDYESHCYNVASDKDRSLKSKSNIFKYGYDLIKDNITYISIAENYYYLSPSGTGGNSISPYNLTYNATTGNLDLTYGS